MSLDTLLVKTEISEVLNAITMMGQNLQMAMTTQMTTCPGPQTFQNAPARQANFQRQDQPRPGTAGTQCYMCHEMAHLITVVPSWLSTLGLEKSLGMCRTFL